MNKISATKSQSFSLLKRFESMYGDNTANYYKACLNALYNKQIIPSVIIGGGLKNPVGAAVNYLEKKIAEAERAGNIGQGNVTVSKPAKPTYSETDGYFYFVFDDNTKDLFYFGWTPSSKGAATAYKRGHRLASQLISYGNHYSGDELQTHLNTNRKLSKLPVEKKSIASKGYDEYKIRSGYSSATSVGNYEARDLVRSNTEHLTRKEMKIFAKFVKLVKNTKRGSEKDLRSKLIRLAHANPELRKDLLPLLTKKASIPT